MSVYDLTGRKALVTGGGRGLGEGMAQALARAGAAVVIGDIREDLGKACADSLRGAGASAGFVPVDTSAEDARRMLECNVLGTTLGIKYAFRAMRPGGPAGAGGAIVNVASVAA